MKKLICLLMMLCAVGVYAQSDPPPLVQDPDPGTGSGGACSTCEYLADGFTVYCKAHVRAWSTSVMWTWGGEGCQAHNSSVGPNWCTFSGGACRYDFSWEIRSTPTTINTLVQLIGLDETAQVIESARQEAMAANPDGDEATRELAISRLLAARLAVETRARGYGDSYLVIPARQ